MLNDLISYSNEKSLAYLTRIINAFYFDGLIIRLVCA